jgi:hypothetical protein
MFAGFLILFCHKIISAWFVRLCPLAPAALMGGFLLPAYAPPSLTVTLQLNHFLFQLNQIAGDLIQLAHAFAPQAHS